MQEIYHFLDQNNIAYNRFDHEAVFTVEQAEEISGDIDGISAKTLLVFGEKTKKLYLISIEGNKKIQQSRIKELINERVRFGSPEDLERILRVTPGSVSPLGLIFDTQFEINSYIIDQEILDTDLVTWHPNDNTQTLQFSQESFQQFLGLIPHKKIAY